MLSVYILLLLISLKQGSQDVAPTKFNLASESTKNFTKNYMEFDNASYIVYKSLNGVDIDEVTDGDQVVWSESHEHGKAKAIIVAYDNGTPSLLYLYNPLYTYYKYYFDKVDGKWVRTTYEWYSYKLELIKAKISHEFKMDIGLTMTSNKFMHYPQNLSKCYDTYIPFNGYAAKSVCYSATTIWTAKSDHERAVAVWAYKHHQSHYLVRILIFDDHSHYKFRDFIRLRNYWVSMDNTPVTMKPTHKYPDDILFPEYLILKTEKQGSSGETNTSTGSYDSTTGLAISYDYEYHNKPIPSSQCWKLDFLKPLHPLVGSYEKFMIHKVLGMKSYYPNPGYYFDVVTDGKDKIYQRNIDVEACIAVHIYYKDSMFYLADVVVTNPKKPRSEYHVKVNGKWSPVSDNKFFSLLDELIIHERNRS